MPPGLAVPTCPSGFLAGPRGARAPPAGGRPGAAPEPPGTGSPTASEGPLCQSVLVFLSFFEKFVSRGRTVLCGPDTEAGLISAAL